MCAAPTELLRNDVPETRGSLPWRQPEPETDRGIVYFQYLVTGRSKEWDISDEQEASRQGALHQTGSLHPGGCRHGAWSAQWWFW